MSTNSQRIEPPDLSQYEKNRVKFPLEQLEPFRGKFIAWSPDGTRVLASGESLDAVDDALAAAGIHFSQVVHDYVDDL